MRRFGVIVLLMAFVEILACNNNNRKGKNYNITAIDSNTLAFMRVANESNLAEIQLSQLALKNSKDTGIISMAKKIIADHTDASAQLKKIAGKDKVTLSDTLSAIHNQSLKSLAAKKDTAFDKAYTQVMVNDHEKAISLYKSAAEHTTGDIQDFAEQTLPKLQAHFNTANNLCNGLK